MNTFHRGWLAGWLAVLLVLATLGSAQAHGSHTSPIQTFTQVIGSHEIGLTIEKPAAAPATMNVDVEVPNDIGVATMVLRAAPRGQAFSDANRAVVTTIESADQPIYYTQLAVDRLGDWEIELVVEGPQGGIATIPFNLPQTPLPTWSIPLFAGIGAMIVLMIASIAISAMFHSRRAKVPTWLSWGMGHGIFAALIVVIIFGVLQFNSSTQEARAAASGATYYAAGTIATGTGRPHANLVLTTEPAAPQVGEPVRLIMNLTDGGTGLPVDDIVTHHDALIHLAVISEDSSFFVHTHPPRLGPGQYAIDITPTQAGRYIAFAEFERIDSGTQLLRSEFTVAGESIAPLPAAGFGSRTVDGIEVTVENSQSTLVAGQQNTITFSFRDAAGEPILDLKPWLGMAGHLMAYGDGGAVFAHVHAAERMPPFGRPILINGINYGPEVRFVYTFPEAGVYTVWGQFKHDGRILTVPVSIEVQP